MYRAKYKIVTRNGRYLKVNYFINTSTNMSSKILPSLLEYFFALHPNDTLVYAKLYELVKE